MDLARALQSSCGKDWAIEVSPERAVATRVIWLRRATARSHDRRRKREVWRTFDPLDRSAAFAAGFGNLQALDENRLPPAAEIPPDVRPAAEIVTYVREGAIACRDSTGHAGIICAGEFARMTTSRGVEHREVNASQDDWAQVFRIRLHDAERGADREQKRFSTAERRGVFRVVASPDVHTGSLRLHQDTWIFSAILAPGQHVVHELARHRAAWLHVVAGDVTLGDVVLTAGDGAGLTGERAVSLTARAPAEILLLDVVVHALHEGST
jgi:quercetin 2,3-dioxygenase